MKIKYLISTFFLSFVYYVNRNNYSGDSYVYRYISNLYNFNKVPYLDSFDHKGITLYLIQSIGFNIKYSGVFIEYFIVLLSILFLIKTINSKFESYKIYIILLFVLLSYNFLFESLLYTENYAFAFQIIAFSLFLDEKRNIYKNILIGILFLMSFTIRANLIGFWLALFILEFLNIISNKNSKKCFINLFQYFIGILVYGLLLMVYFIRTNSFNEFIECSFIFNFSYSSSNLFSILSSIVKSVRFYDFSIILFLGILFSSFLLSKKKKINFSILTFLWCFFELILSNLSPLAFAHYYIMWIPVSIASIISIYYFIDLSKLNLKRDYNRMIIIFCFFNVSWFLFPSIVKVYKLISSKNIKELKKDEAIDFVNNKYPNESILVLGNENNVYLQTKRISDNYYSYQTPIFYYNAPIIKKMIKRFTKDVILSKPKLILDSRNPFITVDYNKMIDKDYLKSKRFIGSIVNKNGILDNHKLLKDFRSFVNLNYLLIKETKLYDIYILKQ